MTLDSVVTTVDVPECCVESGDGETVIWAELVACEVSDCSECGEVCAVELDG